MDLSQIRHAHVGRTVLVGLALAVVNGMYRVSAATHHKVPGGFADDQLRFEATNEDPATVFAVVARESESNFSRLRTWSAVFTFQDTQNVLLTNFPALKKALVESKPDFQGERLMRIVTGIVEIEFDARKEVFFSRLKSEKCVLKELPAGQVIARIRPGEGLELRVDEYHINLLYEQNSIVRPEEYVHFQPHRTYGRFAINPDALPNFGRAAFRDPVERSQQLDSSVVVSPRKLFGDGTQATWDLAARVSEEFQTHLPRSGSGNETGSAASGPSGVELRRAQTPQGPVYWLRSRIGTEIANQRILDYFWDGRAACNITSAKISDNKGRVEAWTESEFAAFNGVYVPIKVVRTLAADEGPYLKFQRILELTECKVNYEIAPDAFTYKRLGLEDGERVVDRIRSKLFVYRGGVLKETRNAKLQFFPQRDVRNPQWKLTVFALNVIVLLVVVAIVLCRRKRARDS